MNEKWQRPVHRRGGKSQQRVSRLLPNASAPGGKKVQPRSQLLETRDHRGLPGQPDAHLCLDNIDSTAGFWTRPRGADHFARLRNRSPIRTCLSRTELSKRAGFMETFGKIDESLRDRRRLNGSFASPDTIDFSEWGWRSRDLSWIMSPLNR